MWVAIIFIWIVCGGICSYLAEKKDKDKWWAFLIGILFGLWAIIYYLLCKKGGVPCKFCKELISKDAIVCPICKKDLPIEEFKKKIT